MFHFQVTRWRAAAWVSVFLLLQCATGPKDKAPSGHADLQEEKPKETQGKSFSEKTLARGWTLSSKNKEWVVYPGQRSELGLPILTLKNRRLPDLEVYVYSENLPPGKFQPEEINAALGYLYKVGAPKRLDSLGPFEVMLYPEAHATLKGRLKTWTTDTLRIHLFVRQKNQSPPVALPGLQVGLTKGEPSDGIPNRILESQIHNTLGLMDVQDSNYQAALGKFQSAVTLDPEYPPYLINLAAMYQALEEPAAGAQVLENRLDLVKKDPTLSGVLGDFYEKMEQYQAAREWASHALTMEPRNENWLINLSDALWRLGKKVQSKNVLLDLEASQPTQRLSLYLAGTHLGLEEFARAEQVLSEMEKKFKINKKHMEYRMICYNGLKDYSAALSYFRRKVPEDSVTARMLVQKARAEFNLKNYLIAEFSLKKAFELDPGDEQGQKLWTQIKALMGARTNLILKEPIPSLLANVTPAGLKEILEPHRTVLQEAREILLVQRKVRFTWSPGKKWRRSTRLIYYIPAEDPARTLPELTFELNPEHHRLHANQFDLYDENLKEIRNGTVNDYYVSKIHDNTVHPENLMVHFPIKDKTGGRYVVATLSEESTQASSEFPYLSYTTRGTYRFLENSYEISYPPPHLNTHVFGEVSVDSNAQKLVFHFSPETYRNPEKFSPNFEEFGSGFSMAPLATWKEVGDKYLTYLEEKGVSYDSLPFAVKEQSREVLEILFPGKPPLEAFYAYVRDAIRYNNYEFNLHALIPEGSREVMAKKSGDCKGHALLLLHLLKTVGIHAQLALINTDFQGYPNLPHLHQFNHMLVYYRDPQSKQEYFLDPTEKYQPFRRAPYAYEGKNALILEKKGSRLSAVPEITDSTEHGVRIYHSYAVRDNGNVWGRDSLVIRGKLAAEFRQQMDKWDDIDKTEVLMSWISHGYSGFWNGGLNIHGEKAVDSALVLVFHYRQNFSESVFTSGQWVRNHLERSLFRFPEAEGRQAPIYFPYYIHIESHWAFTFPRNTDIRNLSSGDRYKKHLKWSRSVQRPANHRLEIQQTWKLEPFVAEAEDYQDIYGQWSQVWEEASFEIKLN